WVNTYSQEFINWATPHYATFTFPDDPSLWQKIVLRLTIECPGSPNDCDPWDRLGHLRIVTPDQGDVEIARFVTPFDITGTGYPGSCSWTHNVTPYKGMLSGDVELRLYVESWIGGSNGWLLTLDFGFIEGELAEEPVQVIRLFGDDFLAFGDPADPIPFQMPAVDVAVPADLTRAEVRVYATGHGQGNTENCAEFCRKEHRLTVGGTLFSHLLWRSNCNVNTCAPQGGTWQFARAGWCPGAPAQPWIVDVTSALVPGQVASFGYDVEPYENLCRPSPDCVVNGQCPDCNYNSNGHTPPHYTVQADVVFYRDRANVVTVDLSDRRDGGLDLSPAAPNPFAPETNFEYTVPRAGDVELLIYDTGGRLVRRELRHHGAPGRFSFRWDGTDRDGSAVPAGVYFYSVRMDGKSESRKMIRVR
ncbi:MAG: T9SS type A sorting domain-containing protein, partial [Gemmatimonadetes bacterium]|nr:T9SS type A sorting domain-containing protein [Gemmatimonadota bacterium]